MWLLCVWSCPLWLCECEQRVRQSLVVGEGVVYLCGEAHVERLLRRRLRLPPAGPCGRRRQRHRHRDRDEDGHNAPLDQQTRSHHLHTALECNHTQMELNAH